MFADNLPCLSGVMPALVVMFAIDSFIVLLLPYRRHGSGRSPQTDECP